MPTYEYQCRSCGYEMEEFQSMTEPALTLCPRCNTHALVRVIGGGAGLLFKGTGFYITDYRKGAPPEGGAKKEKDGGGKPGDAPKPPAKS